LNLIKKVYVCIIQYQVDYYSSTVYQTPTSGTTAEHFIMT
jgi:hypothetical protein